MIETCTVKKKMLYVNNNILWSHQLKLLFIYQRLVVIKTTTTWTRLNVQVMFKISLINDLKNVNKYALKWSRKAQRFYKNEDTTAFTLSCCCCVFIILDMALALDCGVQMVRSLFHKLYWVTKNDFCCLFS